MASTIRFGIGRPRPPHFLQKLTADGWAYLQDWCLLYAQHMTGSGVEFRRGHRGVESRVIEPVRALGCQ